MLFGHELESYLLEPVASLVLETGFGLCLAVWSLSSLGLLGVSFSRTGLSVYGRER